MRTLRWPLVVVLLIGPGLLSCTDDDAGSGDKVRTGSDAADVGDAGDAGDAGDGGVGAYQLPFGLVAVDGLTMIGRPAVLSSDGEPVPSSSAPVTITAPVTIRKALPSPGGREPAGTSVDPAALGRVELTAAFRVDADDPVGAFDAFVAELERSDDLRLGELRVRRSDGARADDPWLNAEAVDGRDYADVQLWTTEDQPILLVTTIQQKGGGDAETTMAAPEVDAGDPPASSLAWAERTEGDALFEEQGTVINVPEGSRTLMPTVPVFCGTGGSFTVLSAEDGRAAVDSLIAEAEASSDQGDTDEPDERDDDGVTVVTASFFIDAGGWDVGVTSVRGPDDEAATLYVSSCAD